MAKSKQQKLKLERDLVQTRKRIINTILKGKAVSNLNPQTVAQLKELQGELYNKRKMNPDQLARFELLYKQAQKERESAERDRFKAFAKQSGRKLIERRAEKLAGKGATKALEKYEKSYREEIKAEIENIYDRQYAQTVSNYSTEDKQEILRRMLGIGSRGVTLADGSIFTVEDFNKILDRHGISLDRFTDKEDITKERYKQVKYTEWKRSISNEINQLLNLKDLTDREREGLRKMFKIYGT